MTCDDWSSARRLVTTCLVSWSPATAAATTAASPAHCQGRRERALGDRDRSASCVDDRRGRRAAARHALSHGRPASGRRCRASRGRASRRSRRSACRSARRCRRCPRRSARAHGRSGERLLRALLEPFPSSRSKVTSRVGADAAGTPSSSSMSAAVLAHRASATTIALASSSAGTRHLCRRRAALRRTPRGALELAGAMPRAPRPCRAPCPRRSRHRGGSSSVSRAADDRSLPPSSGGGDADLPGVAVASDDAGPGRAGHDAKLEPGRGVHASSLRRGSIRPSRSRATRGPDVRWRTGSGRRLARPARARQSTLGLLDRLPASATIGSNSRVSSRRRGRRGSARRCSSGGSSSPRGELGLDARRLADWRRRRRRDGAPRHGAEPESASRGRLRRPAPVGRVRPSPPRPPRAPPGASPRSAATRQQPLALGVGRAADRARLVVRLGDDRLGLAARALAHVARGLLGRDERLREQLLSRRAARRAASRAPRPGRRARRARARSPRSSRRPPRSPARPSRGCSRRGSARLARVSARPVCTTWLSFPPSGAGSAAQSDPRAGRPARGCRPSARDRAARPSAGSAARAADTGRRRRAGSAEPGSSEYGSRIHDVRT